MGFLSFFANRLLVTKCLNIQFKICSLLWLCLDKTGSALLSKGLVYP